MLRRLAAEKAQDEAAQKQRNEQLAKSASLAAEFIALMRKYSIRPEPIYSREQVRGRRYKDTVEEFKLVGQGWVIDYKLNKFDSPWLIKCLRPDGKYVECHIQPVSGEFKSRGLVKPPARTVLGSYGVLWLGYNIETPEPHDPYFDKEVFAQAAQWYLT